MQIFWISSLSVIALAWLVLIARIALGLRRLPRLEDVTPAADSACPAVSILCTARDEAEKLPTALATLVAQDYPRYEVVAVNDRSVDSTGRILEEFASKHRQLKVIHISELPKGWLGKPHGLEKAYQAASGEWLVFTDADVRFAPDLLRRSITVAQEKGWDHLTLFGILDVVGFWEKVLLTYYMLGFQLYAQAWRVSNPKSRTYLGIGMFQLLRRSAYQAIGTHKRLAMEVLDDMKLGKLIKQHGFRSGVALADDALRVRWQAGLGNLIRGTTKNFFAASGFRVTVILLQIGSVLASGVLPFVALLAASGAPRLIAAFAVGLVLLFHGACAREGRISPLYALTHPLGALIFGYMLARSMVINLWQGGIVWRDTFYPLEELRRGLV